MNYYAYARNNPLVNIDPDGKSAKTFLYGVGIGALWAASAVFIVAASPVVIPAAVLTGAAVVGLGLVGYGTYENYQAYNNGSITKDQFDYNAGKLFGGTAAPAKLGEFGWVKEPVGIKESTAIKDNILVNTKIHGNSLDSPKLTTGYTLRKEGSDMIMKFGETTRPDTRYSNKYLGTNNVYFNPETTGSKQEMHFWQHDQILQFRNSNQGQRPPLNKSDW